METGNSAATHKLLCRKVYISPILLITGLHLWLLHLEIY
ncbi:LOW QUALITY PROTEIN: CNTN6 isoform 5 [Pongo abelii]|uniref:CNTN6 isoform 5 n=1 Tax=Pongo abelii TaxID=9601 RepID=A0A2J8WE87_PONAB|nr:LOW QUALITY PROTEIN: CNTN6 isoform 5 [Pongo abelii]